MNILVRVLLLMILLAALPGAAGAEDTKVDYRPAIHGALRARYEYSTPDHSGRFQMRNARLMISGNIAPVVYYFVQADLCDRGSMKILDAYGRLSLSPSFYVQAGQFLPPFGTACFRTPGSYIFANRSFVGKEINSGRSVGAKVSWLHPFTGGSINLEAGAFNPDSPSRQDVWNSTLAYAARAIIKTGPLTTSLGVKSIRPDSIRANMLGGSLNWASGHWTVEGEYIYKHYTNKTHTPCHGYNVWADYGFPVKAGVFNRASFQARVDGMSDHSSGTRNKEGRLITDHPGRDRISVGGTISYVAAPVRCDVRVSYEKYFYRRSITPGPGDNDKICAELVVKF